MREAVADVVRPIQRAHKMWGWYLTLGVALILLGAYCIYADVSATFASIWAVQAALKQ